MTPSHRSIGLVSLVGNSRETFHKSGTDGSNPVPSSGESGELPYCAAGSSDLVERRPGSLARELIAEFDHPDIGRVRQPKPAARFDRTPAEIQGPAPRIGEHSAAILAELGLEAAEIERLATEKIVRLTKR